MMLKEGSPRNTMVLHYEVSNKWMDGLTDGRERWDTLVCLHCQSGTGLNAGDACICSALCTTGQPLLFHISKKNKIKTNCQPQKGKIVKFYFPSAVGCLGFVPWQGCFAKHV